PSRQREPPSCSRCRSFAWRAAPSNAFLLAEPLRSVGNPSSFALISHAGPGRDNVAGGRPRATNEDAMDKFRETAFYLTVWHAFLATLVAVLLIVINDFEPTTALLVAANLTLVFSLVLVARASRLTEQRIARGQFWRTVPPMQRP